jgi:hypothetical protein
MTIKHPYVTVKLTESNGNAFAILGACQKAAKKAGLSPKEISDFMEEAQSGDYDNLLQTCMEWFTIE